ncbi:MAG: APHP domain-containing protein, partial [Symploca sp. SIO2D2]|nr:APHP domain-containing protein [Symploca sp. SIO2D2]
MEFRDEFNNSAVTDLQVTPVIAPDLQVTEITADERVFTGRQFSVSYTVTNVSTGDVPDRQGVWFDYVYLSRDQFLDPRGDHFLRQVRHEGILEANGSYTVNLTFSVPRGLLGAYYIIVDTDRADSRRPSGFVLEGANEDNNDTASPNPLLIELPPPSDLVVTLVNSSASAEPGDTISLTWTVENQGDESAIGRWADSVYLSSDSIWDLGDRLILNEDFAPRTLAPGQSYTFATTAQLPAVLPGDYRLIVRTDIFDDINEGANNANNATASVDALSITVPTLQLGVPLDGLISAGDDFLFRVFVEAGETLRIDLDSDDDNLTNELYARFEALPSSRAFDAAYEGGLQGDQTALVPRTEGGFYYIRVRNFQSAPADSEVEPPPSFADVGFSLTASLLPFAITNVTPDNGGDGRYATLTVTGAKFDPSATLKLIRPSFAELAPVSYEVIDATRIIATFDLSDAPLGLYDVQVTNPNGDIAVVPYRFLVEPALPLDLTVGLGGPSDIPISREGASPALYQLGALSLTNLDTPYVHLSFGVPRLQNNTVIPGERLIFSTNLMGSPDLDGVEWSSFDPVLNLDGRLTAEGFVYDLHNQGFSAVSFLVEIYPELDAILEEDPQFFDSLLDQEIEDLAFEFYIYAAATPLSSAEYVDLQTERAEEIRLAILADEDAPQALTFAASDALNFG